MSTPDAVPLDVGADLEREVRLLSAHSALFSQAVAERVGITATELETLELFNLYGSMSPGRLAELTGLTTGGVTRLIDRLERGGFVAREPDPEDRRRVVLRPLGPATEERIYPFFAAFAERMHDLWSTYPEEYLDIFLDYARRTRQIMEDEAARLRLHKDTGCPPGD